MMQHSESVEIYEDIKPIKKIKLVVNAIMGAQMAALSEGMALAEKCDLDQVTLLEARFRNTHFSVVKLTNES